MKNMKKFFLIFLVVGIALFIGGGVFYAINRSFYKDAEKTKAIITDIQRVASGSSNKTSHEVYVAYVANDMEIFDVKLGYYTSGMKVGDVIDVYYNPANPYRVKSKSGDTIVIIIMGGIGLVFSAIGIIGSGLIGGKKKWKKKGVKYRAEIIGIVPNMHCTINGIHPYQVECKAWDPENGCEILFRSGNYLTDPSYSGITEVDVYVNPKNKRKYYVDVQAAIDEANARNNVYDYR